MSAKRFSRQRKHRHASKQLQEVIRLIVFCYRKILESESYDLEKINEKKSVKPEDYLKYRLVEYLKRNKSFFPRISHLIFKGEVGEYCIENDRESFNDITILNIDLGLLEKRDERFTSEDYYFSFECKRLRYLGKNQLYIREGIKRYVENSYAKAMPIAGMIGFVEAGDIQGIKDDINRRLGEFNEKGELTTTRLLEFSKVEADFEYSYSSEHERVHNTRIHLYHLFLDYSPIIL